MIDLREKDMSRGEFNSVKQAVGGIDSMINENAKDKDVITLMKYLSDSDKEEKLIENQQVIKTPIVRNGRQATIGFCPDVWKNWE
jgi:arsenate reductase